MTGDAPTDRGDRPMAACDACLRRARLLQRLSGRLEHLHAEHGLMDDVLALGDGELIAALVPSLRDRREIMRRHRCTDAQAERAAARQAGLGVLCRHDSAYPAGLVHLAGPPAALFVRGPERLNQLCSEPAVAIVGARRASSYGLETARALGRGAAAARLTIVSGMALGVDSAAHEGALEAGGRTIAVLAGGADVPYPASKRGLHRRLGEAAVLLSELPPGTRPARWSFPARNRIIAAVAAMTVVVEAAERSGALITARIARDLGREVGAVPGRITSPLASGPNDLLRDGAHLVDGAQAVVDVVCGPGMRPVPKSGDPAGLDPHLAATLIAIREGRDTVGALVDAGQDAPAVLTALGELELRGHIRRAPGGVYVPLS